MIKSFLLDQLILLGFLAITLLFFSVFLAVLQIPLLTIVTVLVIALILITSWLIISYTVARKKLESFKRIVTQIEQPYLAGEILPKADSFLAQQYFDVMRSISKDAIERVEQANQQAQEYKEFVEQWIHELKTPMTAMSLILANEGDLRKLRKELKRLDNLTDQILHFARLQSIEKDKLFEEFEVTALLNHAVKNQMTLLIGAQIQVVIEGEGTLYTDQKVLQFIINQFLINSAKYCPGSKVKIAIQGNRIQYEDDGIGIAQHELPRIFEKGYTGTNGRKLGTSTGMGLYIVAKLCQELHIKLEVQSEIARYTRFTLVFPQI